MTMIERVADFLKLRDESVMPDEADDEERRGSAAAILELLREPTEWMKNAGARVPIQTFEGPEATVLTEEAGEIFTAMITAALEETQ